MAYKIEVDFPDFEKGVEFDVGGVLVPNGGSVELTAEQEQDFVSRHQAAVKDQLGSEYVKVTGSSSLSKKTVDDLTPEVSDTPVVEGGDN